MIWMIVITCMRVYVFIFIMFYYAISGLFITFVVCIGCRKGRYAYVYEYFLWCICVFIKFYVFLDFCGVILHFMERFLVICFPLLGAARVHAVYI